MTNKLKDLSWSLVGDPWAERVYTTRDADRLRSLARTMRPRAENGQKEAIEELLKSLDNGRMVESRSIPCDVVTMNSTVVVEDEISGAATTVTVVLPNAEDKAKKKISVLTPMGLAILGLKPRHEVEFRSESGTWRISIEKILYQPQAFGHYNG